MKTHDSRQREKNVLNLDRNLRTWNSIKSIGNLISLGVVYMEHVSVILFMLHLTYDRLKNQYN